MKKQMLKLAVYSSITQLLVTISNVYQQEMEPMTIQPQGYTKWNAPRS